MPDYQLLRRGKKLNYRLLSLFIKQKGRRSTPIPCFLRRAPSAFFSIPALQMMEPH